MSIPVFRLLAIALALAGAAPQVRAQITPGPITPVDPSLSRCPEEAVVKDGRPQIPNGATDIVGPVDVDQVNGPVSGIYGQYDTSTDGFYEQLPCEPAIGGEVPPEAMADESDEDLAAESEFQSLTALHLDDLIASAAPIGPLDLPDRFGERCTLDGQPVDCNDPRFLRDDQPFAGRDIIYVHGLSLEHMTNFTGGYAPAQARWPADRAEFDTPGGYFFEYARTYWKDHVREHLFDIDNPANATAGYQWPPSQSSASYVPKSNRILTVGWATTQRLAYAQHNFLTQVIDAMNTGRNVITPPGYPSVFDRPFCSNGCVVVSHSTGGLLVSTAMGKLARGDYGNHNRDLVGAFRAHLAFSGAFGGSRLAQLLIVVSNVVPATSTLCTWAASFLNDGPCGWDGQAAINSVLLDLTPPYTTQHWAPVMDDSPVLTLAVGGAHTRSNYAWGLAKVVHPGNDDGVETMHSQCANPQPVLPPTIAPSGFTFTSWAKAYDMGVPLVRGIGQFLDQRHIKALAPAAKYMSAMCTPWLSPSGMVMPVASSLSSTPWDARQRHSNHFSFIQGAIDHSFLGASDSANPWPSASGASATDARPYREAYGADLREESSGITDAATYQLGTDGVYLVHPSFAGLPIEIERGRKISFRFLNRTRTWWIWRRIYHVLNHWQDKAASHYAYEYALRR